MKLNDFQIDNLLKIKAAAEAAGHPHPGIAAAEGAVETATADGGWFASPLYAKHNNFLGLKPPSWFKGMVCYFPTREFVPAGKALDPSWKNPRSPIKQKGGTSWLIDGEFCHFNTVEDCARAQMIVLQRGYSFAFTEPSAQDFAYAVSEKWATGPARGNSVVSIYNSHLDILAPVVQAEVKA